MSQTHSDPSDYHRIAELVESGEYFIESRKWFCRMYLSVYTQHIYSLILALTVIITSFIIYTLAQGNYEIQHIPFAIYATDPTEKFPKISALNNGKEEMMISVARYLVSHYVKLRETYEPTFSENDKLTSHLEKIRKLSSRQVYSDFVSFVDPNSNPSSPILRYRDNVTRKIEIKKVHFTPYLSKPDGAIIEYAATEIINNTVVNTRDFAVEVIFDVNIIKNLHKVDISVLSYKYAI